MASINHITVSQAVQHNRFSAEFFDSRYVFSPRRGSTWLPIGRLLRKCEYGLSISMNSTGRGYPIFRMNELDNCLAQRPAKFANISRSLFEIYKLQPNDVLFNRTNSFDFVGRTGIVKDQTDCTFASYLIRLVPDANRLLPEFLTIYLNTPFGIGQVKRRAMRSINQANVSGSEIRKVLIPVVDIEVQKLVQELVNQGYQSLLQSALSYDHARQLLEDELGLKEQTFETQFRKSARFSTTTLKDTYSANRIDAQCFDREVQKYEARVLSKVTCDRLRDLSERFVKGNQQDERSSGSIPYSSIKHIAAREVVSSVYCSSTPRHGLGKPGDLLLAITGATIGKIGVIRRYDAMAFSGDLLRIRANSSISAAYLLLVLDHRVGQVQFNRWITGSTNGHLSPRDAGRVLVPRLEEAKERKIADLVENSLQKRIESERLIEQAKAHVEAIIDEAIEK